MQNRIFNVSLFVYQTASCPIFSVVRFCDHLIIHDHCDIVRTCHSIILFQIRLLIRWAISLPENQAPNSHYDQYDHQQHPDQHISSSSPCPAALFPSLRRRYAIRIHPCILWFSGNPAWAPSCFVLLCSRRAAGFHNPLFSFVHAYLLYRTIITYFFYQSLLICHFKKYFKHSSEIF